MSRTDAQWYAVRCCCGPRKVLGFLRLSDPPRQLMLRDYSGREHPVELKFMTELSPMTSLAEAFRVPAPTVSHTTELAIYSEDRGLDFWSTIPGFIPAGGEHEDHSQHSVASGASVRAGRGPAG